MHEQGQAQRFAGVAVQAGFLFGLWVVLSGKFDALHLVPGALTAVAVAAALARGGRRLPLPSLRFAGYTLWLAWQVVLSNLRVVRVVFSRNPSIAPRVIRVTPGVEEDWRLAVLANSTTLTPGTLTIDVSPDEMVVHALDPVSASDVEAGVIAAQVARLGSGGRR